MQTLLSLCGARCKMQRAAYDLNRVQRATYNAVQSGRLASQRCLRRPTEVQHAACIMQGGTTCSVHHAACIMQHAACTQHVACTIQQRRSGRCRTHCALWRPPPHSGTLLCTGRARSQRSESARLNGAWCLLRAVSVEAACSTLHAASCVVLCHLCRALRVPLKGLERASIAGTVSPTTTRSPSGSRLTFALPATGQHNVQHAAHCGSAKVRARGACCSRPSPHLRRDSPTSAPGLAHICAGTRQGSHTKRPTDPKRRGYPTRHGPLSARACWYRAARAADVRRRRTAATRRARLCKGAVHATACAAVARPLRAAAAADL